MFGWMTGPSITGTRPTDRVDHRFGIASTSRTHRAGFLVEPRITRPCGPALKNATGLKLFGRLCCRSWRGIFPLLMRFGLPGQHGCDRHCTGWGFCRPAGGVLFQRFGDHAVGRLPILWSNRWVVSLAGLACSFSLVIAMGKGKRRLQDMKSSMLCLKAVSRVFNHFKTLCTD